MKKVTALQDENGRLYKTQMDCIEADFITKVQRAWGSMPDQRDRGDPVVIARILASPTYINARTKLSDAISWLEHQLASARADAPAPSPSASAENGNG